MYPIGTERLYSGYVEVKVSRSEWRWKHHLIWEQAHWAIPEGHFICFADGDSRNFSLDNLLAVSRADFAIDRIQKARRAKFPIGSEKVDSKGYIQIKMAEPKSWILKHHLIWETANGPIPEGHSVCFADRNPQNFTLANLILVANRVRGYMIHKNLFKAALEPELFQTAVNVARLGLAFNKKRREIASQHI